VGTGAETVSFSPDGRWLLTTGFDGTARIYSCDVCASLTDLLALARDRVTRQLTPEERHKYLHETIAR
jgi:WD40 repeat protein